MKNESHIKFEKQVRRRLEKFNQLLCSFLKMMEDSTTRFEAWRHAAVDAHSIETLANPAVDLKPLEAWSNVPDVVEGDVGKLTAPLCGDAATETQGQKFVAEVFPEVKAGVGQFPDAVNTVGTVRLAENVVEMECL